MSCVRDSFPVCASSRAWRGAGPRGRLEACPRACDAARRLRRRGVDSIGRRNTSRWGWSVATMRERQRQVQLYRGQVPSPGRPTVAWRADRVRFWAAIARGVKTELAAREAGVSGPVAFRWFRHAGGVNPRLSVTVSGRFLSFGEREEIALLRVQGFGVRAIARRLERSPSTISREAASECLDADLAAGVPGVGRAVARGAAGASSEGREAGRQRAALCVRAGTAERRCTASGWSCGRPAGGALERQERAASRRSALGAGLEPGADLQAAARRVPG